MNGLNPVDEGRGGSCGTAGAARSKFLRGCGVILIDVRACFRWFLKIVPSGSGSGGKSSTPDGLVSLFASRSINQTSSGNLKFLLNKRKLAGTPII